jgi:hypothetical protein
MDRQGIPIALQLLTKFVYVYNKDIKVAAMRLQFIHFVNCGICTDFSLSTDISIMFGLVCAVAVY